MVSYWCMVLKYKFPLEYSVATLQRAKDDDQTIAILRELNQEGYKYKAFDKDKSQLNWSVDNDVLIGGLTGAKGIGEKMAKAIIEKRKTGEELTNHQFKLLNNPITPYDTIFEARDKWGHIIDNPGDYKIASKLSTISEIADKGEGQFVFIAKVSEINIKDLNDAHNLKRRNGKKAAGQTKYLNIKVLDDSEEIYCSVSAFNYNKFGKTIVENKKDCWYIFKGIVKPGIRRVFVNRIKKLSGVEEYELASNA